MKGGTLVKKAIFRKMVWVGTCWPFSAPHLLSHLPHMGLTLTGVWQVSELNEAIAPFKMCMPIALHEPVPSAASPLQGSHLVLGC